VTEQPQRIPSLDGLRAISVSLVVVSHLLWHPDFISVRPVYAKWFAPLGHLGVASLLPNSSRISLLVGITVQNIGIAACLAWSITNYAGKIGKVLNSKPMVFLGVMSYSIYLWQQLFVNPKSSAIISRFPLNLMLLGAASLASYYVIERPSLRIRQRLETRLFAQRRPAIQNKVVLLADGNISSSSTTLAAIPQTDREHTA
jgi:peptidoglycan/LPS O-acetylase OafA/YrhL